MGEETFDKQIYSYLGGGSNQDRTKTDVVDIVYYGQIFNLIVLYIIKKSSCIHNF